MADNESVLIDRFNVVSVTKNNLFNIKLHQEKDKKEYWHKFIIENGAFLDEEKVLLSLLNFLNPQFYLAPVQYTKTEKDSYFLGRQCSDVIVKLCQSGLKVPYNSTQSNPDSGEGSFNLSIEAFSKKTAEFKINICLQLKKSIDRRLKSSGEEEINLSNFHNEPELRKEIFCPLSCKKNLNYVLGLLANSESVSKLRKTKINLSNNNLKDLDLTPLEKLDIKCLDLSNNEIDSTSNLAAIGHSLPLLEEIILQGNPVCSTYPSAIEYIKAVLLSIPRITKLDGFSLNIGFPNHHLWLCNTEGENLVNQFIKHYYSLYDQDRWLLKQIYHPSALFSIMCNEVEEPLQLADLKLECYKTRSRNILKGGGSASQIGEIYQGREKIIEVLLLLPTTTHDFNSFKIDLIYHESEMAVIMVSGVFRDFHKDSSEYRLRSFNRTFVLCKLSPDSYNIINDLYQVTHASKDEVETSFSSSKCIKDDERKKFVGTTEEQRHMVEFFRELTNTNEQFSKKCLEDFNWDFKKALEVYVDHRKNLKIPSEAFYD